MTSLGIKLKSVELEDFVNSIDNTWAVHVYAAATKAYTVLYTGFTTGEAVRALMIDTLDYQARAQHARIS